MRPAAMLGDVGLGQFAKTGLAAGQPDIFYQADEREHGGLL